MKWHKVGTPKRGPKQRVYCDGHAIEREIWTAGNLHSTEPAESDRLVGVHKAGISVPFPGTNAGVVRLFGYVNKKGKVQKFKAPQDWEPRLYFAPLPESAPVDWMADTSIAIYWAEGPLKALVFAWLSGCPTIAANGLDCWSKEREPIADFDKIKWKGRTVILLVDSDAAPKNGPRRSLRRLERHLTSLGANVLVKIIPSLDGGKTDVNDYIKHKGIKALLKRPNTKMPADWGASAVTQELNERLTVIEDGRAEIITVHDDLDHPGTKYATKSNIRNLSVEYANQFVVVGETKAGVPIRKHKLDVWLADPYRARAKRIWMTPNKPWGLDPDTGEFNIWSGWAFEPHRPDNAHRWDALQDHIYEVIANGDKRLAKYVLDWMAFGVQFPDRLPEVALVLMSGEGTGKGIFTQAYGKLFGRHFKHLTQPGELTSRFNDSMKDRLLVFADENFYAGDHRSAATLYQMISERTMTVEAKHQNSYTLPNYRKFIIASNKDWVVPAGPDARRFVVLKVSEGRKGQHAYFKAIADQLASGGYEAMLYDLLHRDIVGFDPRRVPKTKALFDQKLLGLSADPIAEWWFGVLVEGRFDPLDSKWPKTVFRSAITSAVADRTSNHYDLRGLETRIGQVLRRMCPAIRSTRQRMGKKRHRAYVFPSRADCRAAFEKYVDTRINWKTGEQRKEKRA